MRVDSVTSELSVGLNYKPVRLFSSANMTLIYRYDLQQESEDFNANSQFELTPSDSQDAGSTLSGNETVLTHIEEQWDMSDLILDLETKEAELLILQELLSQKEHALQVCQS